MNIKVKILLKLGRNTGERTYGNEVWATMAVIDDHRCERRSAASRSEPECAAWSDSNGHGIDVSQIGDYTKDKDLALAVIQRKVTEDLQPVFLANLAEVVTPSEVRRKPTGTALTWALLTAPPLALCEALIITLGAKRA